MTPTQKVVRMLSKKPGPRAPTMGAMVKTLLGLLCLLLAPAGASQEGEVCMGFLPFRCPQRPDGTDGPFCCGPCLAPYCCDSKEARMDQNKCLLAWRMLETCVRNFENLPASQFLESTPTRGPKIQGRRSSPGDPTPAPSPWAKITPTEVALIVVACVLIAVLILLICECYDRNRRPRNYFAPGYFPSPVLASANPQPPVPIPPLVVYDRPPPYEDMALLPSDTQGNPPSDLSSDEEVVPVAAWPRRWPFTILWQEEATVSAPVLSMTSSSTGSTGASDAAEEVPPEQGTAAGGKVPPAQGAASGGKAAAKQDPASGGGGTSPVMSSAPGRIST